MDIFGWLYYDPKSDNYFFFIPSEKCFSSTYNSEEKLEEIIS